MDEPILATIEEFKNRSDDATGNVKLIKQVDCEVRSAEGDERSLDFVISTGAVDRENDTIDPKGWKLANFRKAGVMLWAHNYRMPPIAKPTKTWVEGDKLRSIATFLGADFADHDHARFADMIFRMYKQRFMRSTSVGFRPMEWERSEERGGMAYDFKKQELLEFSAVPVPANPEALQGAKSAGIDIVPFAKWIEAEYDEGRATAQVTDWLRRQVYGDSGGAVFLEVKDGDPESTPAPDPEPPAPEPDPEPAPEPDPEPAPEPEPDPEPAPEPDPEPAADPPADDPKTAEPPSDADKGEPVPPVATDPTPTEADGGSGDLLKQVCERLTKIEEQLAPAPAPDPKPEAKDVLCGLSREDIVTITERSTTETIRRLTGRLP